MASLQEEVGIKYDDAGRAYKYSNGKWRIVEDRSIGENILLGAGQTFRSLQLGAMQQFGSPATQERARQLFESERGAREYLAEDAPIASAVGRALPYAATAPLSGGTAAGVAGITAIDAGIGGLEYAESAGERLQNMLLAGGGTLAGFGIGSMANRVASNISQSARTISNRAIPPQPGAALPPDALPPGIGRESVGAAATGEPVERAGIFDDDALDVLVGEGSRSGLEQRATLEALDDAEALGYVVPPGAVTGRRGEGIIFDTARTDPFTAEVVESSVFAPNRDLFEADFLRALGATSREAAEGFNRNTLSRVEQRIDNQLSAVYQRNPTLSTTKTFAHGNAAGGLDNVTIDQALERVEQSHRRLGRYRGAEDPVVLNLQNMRQLIDEGGDTISTEAYAGYRSTLRNFQRQANAAGDANSAETLADAVNALDDWFAGNVNKADKELFHDTLQTFRLMNAIDTPNILRPDGTISANAIDRSLRRNFKTEYARNNRFFRDGKNVVGKDLSPEMDRFFRGVRVMNAFPAVIGDSGTSSRQIVSSLMRGDLAAASSSLTRPFIQPWIARRQPSRAQLEEAWRRVGGSGDFTSFSGGG